MQRRIYEIRLHGRIPPDELIEIETMRATVVPAQTVLTGSVPDQAALQGILRRLNALGLELVEMRQLPDADQPASDPPR